VHACVSDVRQRKREREREREESRSAPKVNVMRGKDLDGCAQLVFDRDVAVARVDLARLSPTPIATLKELHRVTRRASRILAFPNESQFASSTCFTLIMPPHALPGALVDPPNTIHGTTPRQNRISFSLVTYDCLNLDYEDSCHIVSVDVFLSTVLPSVKNVNNICQYLKTPTDTTSAVLSDKGWEWFQDDPETGELKGTEGHIYNKSMEQLVASVFAAVEALEQLNTGGTKADRPALKMKFVCDGDKTFVGERLSSHKPDAGLTLVGDHKKSLEAPEAKTGERLHVEDVFLAGEYKRDVRELYLISFQSTHHTVPMSRWSIKSPYVLPPTSLDVCSTSFTLSESHPTRLRRARSSQRPVSPVHFRFHHRKPSS
jgi:hypothetical protein